MSIEIVADKYSSAMFELAQEQNMLELMEEQLGYVASVMVDQPELRSFLEIQSLQKMQRLNLVKFLTLVSIKLLYTLFM